MSSTVEHEVEASAFIVGRQQRLLDRCRCVECGDAVELEVVAGDSVTVSRGALVCRSCGHRTEIQDFQVVSLPSLVRRHPGIPDAALRIELETPTLISGGTWLPVGFGHVGYHDDSSPSTLAYSGVFEGIEISARCGDWSGILEVVLDGTVAASHDLFAPRPGFLTVTVPNSTRAGTVEIRLAAQPNPRSHGNQMIIDRVAVLRVPAATERPAFGPIGRGNPHPPRFLELVAEAAPDAFIVDCGGGERRIGDPRIFNLEYGRATAVDLVADCERIPLADGSVDLLLSQAVLEHVQHPPLAAAEIARVLRPGGVAFVEAAYMQPYHPVPDHYFNLTPSALRLIFAGLEVVGEGTFGTLEDTMNWLATLAKDADSGAAVAVDALVDAARRFDEVAGPTVLRHFASAAWIEVRRPSD